MGDFMGGGGDIPDADALALLGAPPGADPSDTTWFPDANGAGDEPPPDESNFPGAELIKSGVAAGMNWAQNAGGDYQPRASYADWSMGGGIQYRGSAPNLGTYPMNPGLRGGVQRSGAGIGGILSMASAGAGFPVTRKALVYLIRTLGIPAVMALTKLGAEALLYFWMKRPKRGARGPHLRTVVRRVKQGERYKHMLAKYARKAHAIAPRGSGSFPFHRRRKKK